MKDHTHKPYLHEDSNEPQHFLLEVKGGLEYKVMWRCQICGVIFDPNTDQQPEDDKDIYEDNFFIVWEGDGCETWFPADSALLVPYDTLSGDRKKRIRDGDSKIFKHGGRFAAISMNEVIESLEQAGKMGDFVARCWKMELGL